jgi:AcrR family transcriptional regulator
MDSPDGQHADTAGRPASSETRRRLLRSAAELIAEVGWGRVTTRAVAARAGLPHGAVSYHFRGKQELLIEATLHTFEEAFPVAELEAHEAPSDFVELLEAWFGSQDAADPLVTGVGIEAMLESERDPVLRTRLAATLHDYRRALTHIAETAQERGTMPSSVSPAALATLLAAVGDGLFLHARLDPEVDAAGALAALRTLLVAAD